MKKSAQVFVNISLLVFVLALASCVEQKYIDSPEVGDVYLKECKDCLEGYPVAYNFIKIKEISGDSLLVMPNVALYHDKVYCLTALDYFNSKDAYYISKNKVKEMFAAGEIVDAVRYYEGTCLGHDK